VHIEELYWLALLWQRASQVFIYRHWNTFFFK